MPEWTTMMTVTKWHLISNFPHNLPHGTHAVLCAMKAVCIADTSIWVNCDAVGDKMSFNMEFPTQSGSWDTSHAHAMKAVCIADTEWLMGRMTCYESNYISWLWYKRWCEWTAMLSVTKSLLISNFTYNLPHGTHDLLWKQFFLLSLV